MPSPKFVVSSRATKGGPTQQVTIPAAIARKLPQGISIRWEVSVVKGGLFFKYLGPNAEVAGDPEIELDFVPASDLKEKPKAKAKPAEVEVPAKIEEPLPVEQPEVEVEADVTEEESVVEDDDEAPF